MSQEDKSIPAFPRFPMIFPDLSIPQGNLDITYRQWLVGLAMQSIIQKSVYPLSLNAAWADFAQMAHMQADAILAFQEKENAR